jgi:hypothetical protein
MKDLGWRIRVQFCILLLIANDTRPVSGRVRSSGVEKE